MKSTKFISTFLIVILLVFMSCQVDDGIGDNQHQQNSPDTFSEFFGDEISRDFLGTVIDKNNLSIPGVTITIGNETVLTDSNGVFIIQNANVNQRFGYVKAEKAGYISGSRSVVPTEGTNIVTIMLLDANIVGTVNSGSSETVSLANGSSVSFDGNFVKEDGLNYSGSVNVIVKHLDPTDEDMSVQMPGMLYAQNEDGEERMLQTLGMLAVELRGENGEDLNLAEGSTSEIKIPVDVSLMGIAPSTIPLWYFDEVNGYWKEEGEASLQGNMYVGTVSHFSFWNCDIPAEAITLCVTVIDEDGNELNDLLLEITSSVFGTSAGYTNGNGQVCGLVPSNEILELIVRNYNCDIDITLSTQTIGPFISDASLSIVVEDNSNSILETIIGNFNTCDGDPVTNGYVKMNYGSQVYLHEVIDGTFVFNLSRCTTDNNMFSIIGTDYANLLTTDYVNYTFTTPTTNTGVIIGCNNVSEYVQYTVEGYDTVLYISNINTTFTPIANPIYPLTHELSISGSNASGNTSHHFNFGIWPYAPDFIGTYGIDDVWFNGSDGSIGSQFFVSIQTLTISALGDVGEYIDINFSGSHSSDTGIKPINGVMHVLRDE